MTLKEISKEYGIGENSLRSAFQIYIKPICNGHYKYMSNNSRTLLCDEYCVEKIIAHYQGLLPKAQKQSPEDDKPSPEHPYVSHITGKVIIVKSEKNNIKKYDKADRTECQECSLRKDNICTALINTEFHKMCPFFKLKK